MHSRHLRALAIAAAALPTSIFFTPPALAHGDAASMVGQVVAR